MFVIGTPSVSHSDRGVAFVGMLTTTQQLEWPYRKSPPLGNLYRENAKPQASMTKCIRIAYISFFFINIPPSFGFAIGIDGATHTNFRTPTVLAFTFTTPVSLCLALHNFKLSLFALLFQLNVVVPSSDFHVCDVQRYVIAAFFFTNVLSVGISFTHQ